MTHPSLIAKRIAQHPTESALTTLEIYPTLRCNLDCQFCDTTDRHQPPMDERSLSQWTNIIQDFAQMGGEQIFILGGGEPFVYPHLIELLCIAKEFNLWGMLTTNGTLIRPEYRHQMCQIGWDEIHFSLDGATPETHDKIRGKFGTYRKVIQNVCAFNVLKTRYNIQNPTLVFHWVITNQNLAEIPMVLDLAENLGVQRVDFDSLIAYKPDQQQLALSETEQQTLQSMALAICSRTEHRTVSHNLSQFTQTVEKRGVTLPPSGTHDGLLGAPCYKPWHHLTIQANGRTSPCCVLAGSGDAITEDLQSFWHSNPYFQEMRLAMLEHRPPDRCSECSNNILQQERLIQEALIQLCGST